MTDDFKPKKDKYQPSMTGLEVYCEGSPGSPHALPIRMTYTGQKGIMFEWHMYQCTACHRKQRARWIKGVFRRDRLQIEPVP